MFTIRWADAADKSYKQLKTKAGARLKNRKTTGKKKSSKDEGLFKQIHKTIALLQNNPKHPGLNTHEYNSIENPFDKQAKVFEAYAQNKTPSAYRVFWCYGPAQGEITIIAITPHP
jgi:hypothetical protein